MKRLFEDNLKDWKINPSRKPLIVRGARQVGKTYTIELFAKSEFENIVKIDFEKNNNFKKIFDGEFDIKKIIDLISIETNIDIIPTKTLLFFDEIQLCPRALMSLRYFYEDMPELHVISAGSLLEFELEKISFPVVRVESQFMYPLTFEEFLLATGNQRVLCNRPDIYATTKIDELIHLKFLKLLKDYFVVGGMPEVVLTYINKSLREVANVQTNLVESFMQDIIKYERCIDVDSLRYVFEKIPSLIGQEIKYTTISKTLSNYKIKQILEVLKKALLIHPILSSSATGLPLMSGANLKVFKYCFFDIGLMQNFCGISPNDIISSSDLLNVYSGSLCEQFVGQELIAAGGSQNKKLFYWHRNKKNSNAEIDYLLIKDGCILPIEVKNGPSGKLKSLHLFLKEHQQIKQGYVLNSSNIGVVDNIKFLPIYTKL